jgi:hypothetical protein
VSKLKRNELRPVSLHFYSLPKTEIVVSTGMKGEGPDSEAGEGDDVSPSKPSKLFVRSHPSYKDCKLNICNVRDHELQYI